MKKELLEIIIRECVKEVLEAFPQEPETIGAPAPPAAGQGTADQPPIPQAQPEPQAAQAAPISPSARGVLFLDPKRPGKPLPLKLSGVVQEPAKLERELYRIAAKSGGPRLKVSSAALREVPKTLANPQAALFLYIGKQNPDDPDTELYLLPAKTLQQATDSSVPAGVSAEHPTTAIASPDQAIVAKRTGGKTVAPDIDEGTKLRNMLSEMIKEALAEVK
jgi:hypothetical protein